MNDDDPTQYGEALRVITWIAVIGFAFLFIVAWRVS